MADWLRALPCIPREDSYRIIALFIQQEVNTNGIPAGSEENEERVTNWLEMLDDFENFTEDAEGEHHLYNLELIYNVKLAIQSGQ